LKFDGIYYIYLSFDYNICTLFINDNMITVSKINFKEEIQILLKFEQNEGLYSLVKSMSGVRYNARYRGW